MQLNIDLFIHHRFRMCGEMIQNHELKNIKNKCLSKCFLFVKYIFLNRLELYYKFKCCSIKTEPALNIVSFI